MGCIQSKRPPKKIIFNPLHALNTKSEQQIRNKLKRCTKKHASFTAMMSGRGFSATGVAPRGQDIINVDCAVAPRDLVCSICLDKFEAKQFQVMTPCGHFYHPACLAAWISKTKECPMCRTVLFDGTDALYLFK